MQLFRDRRLIQPVDLDLARAVERVAGPGVVKDEQFAGRIPPLQSVERFQNDALRAAPGEARHQDVDVARHQELRRGRLRFRGLFQRGRRDLRNRFRRFAIGPGPGGRQSVIRIQPRQRAAGFRPVFFRDLREQTLSAIDAAGFLERAPELVDPVNREPVGRNRVAAQRQWPHGVPPRIRIPDAAADVTRELQPAHRLRQNLVRHQPVGVFAGGARNFFVNRFHEAAARRAFDDVAHDADPVRPENIRRGKIERAQARHVHVHPVAALFVKQFVAEQIRERRTEAAPAHAGLRIGMRLFDDPPFRDDLVGVLDDYPRRQRRLDFVINPEMKFVPVPQKRAEGQQLHVRERRTNPQPVHHPVVRRQRPGRRRFQQPPGVIPIFPAAPPDAAVDEMQKERTRPGRTGRERITFVRLQLARPGRFPLRARHAVQRVHDKIELARQERMVLEAELPHGGDEAALVARPPAGILKKGERAPMPPLHEFGRVPVENKNAAVPVPPVLVGNRDAELIAQRRVQMIAFGRGAAAFHGVPAELPQPAMVRRE